jgi:hypothetical protein
MARTRKPKNLPLSQWRVQQNGLALARLTKALPAIFPAPVLQFALARRWTPSMPRRAVDLYWRQHPLRADRLARALAARSSAPKDWTWRLSSAAKDGLPATFRMPPAPYRERVHARGPGFCCICGQPVYRFGWHADLWDRGPNQNAGWHAACVVAWDLWTGPSDYARLLRRLQARRCASSGCRLWRTAEIDHRVPLFQVWRQHRETAWPALLDFWGLPNLQVINRDVHVLKCAEEAGTRSRSAGARAKAILAVTD